VATTDDIRRADCRQNLAGKDRIGIESVGVGRGQSGVTDERAEFRGAKEGQPLQLQRCESTQMSKGENGDIDCAYSK
jgi:hypothetical protein